MSYHTTGIRAGAFFMKAIPLDQLKDAATKLQYVKQISMSLYELKAFANKHGYKILRNVPYDSTFDELLERELM